MLGKIGLVLCLFIWVVLALGAGTGTSIFAYYAHVFATESVAGVERRSISQSTFEQTSFFSFALTIFLALLAATGPVFGIMVAALWKWFGRRKALARIPAELQA